MKQLYLLKTQFRDGVTETIDSLIENDGIYVKKEIILNINQNLIANKKYDLSEIKEVYSHPQAIFQCRKYIEKKLPNAIINQVSSTALAAKEIKNKDYCACIANKACIEEYDLVILEENIQDNNSNQTKFWILSKSQNNSGDKMSLIFSGKDEPGALYNILGIFYKNNINLSKLESRPAKTELGEYIFLVDLEIKENIDYVIDELEKKCKFVKILGKY